LVYYLVEISNPIRVVLYVVRAETTLASLSEIAAAAKS
jgi:hypothetical protein